METRREKAVRRSYQPTSEMNTLKSGKRAETQSIAARQSADTSSSLKSGKHLLKQSTVESLEKNRLRVQKYRENMNLEQILKKRCYDIEYQKERKESGVVKSIHVMSRRDAKNVRKYWKESSRRYREKKKTLLEATLHVKLENHVTIGLEQSDEKVSTDERVSSEIHDHIRDLVPPTTSNRQNKRRVLYLEEQLTSTKSIAARQSADTTSSLKSGKRVETLCIAAHQSADLTSSLKSVKRAETQSIAARQSADTTSSLKSGKRAKTQSIAARQSADTSSSLKSGKRLLKQSTVEKREKNRLRVKKYRENMNLEQILKKRRSDIKYQKERKESGVVKSIHVMSWRDAKKVRKDWRKSSRRYREKKSLLEATLHVELENHVTIGLEQSDKKVSTDERVSTENSDHVRDLVPATTSNRQNTKNRRSVLYLDEQLTSTKIQVKMLQKKLERYENSGNVTLAPAAALSETLVHAASKTHELDIASSIPVYNQSDLLDSILFGEGV